LVASGNRRGRRRCIGILGWRIMHNSMIRGVRLREAANYRRRCRFILMAVADGRHALRRLVASTVTVASSATSAVPVCLMSWLSAPLRLAGWRRGGLIGVRLRGSIRGLLGVLRWSIRLGSIVWVVVCCGERYRSMRMCVMCGSMAMVWSPLRLSSRIAVRRRVRGAVGHCVLGWVWLPSVFVSRLRVVIVATASMIVAASTTA
jgi:hypothetical protein